jgi:hypothetical protein
MGAPFRSGCNRAAAASPQARQARNARAWHRGAALLALMAVSGALAQRAAPAIDMTGTWVSVVTEDWKYRMVTPDRGVYNGIPLNEAGRAVADAWDPDADAATGEACRSYGAPSIMRVPGRIRVRWEGEDTLRIDTDAGQQTRRLAFAEHAAFSEPSWQGRSSAEWVYAPPGATPPSQPRGGSLKVTTTALRPGYLRKNGVPYSAATVLTEYFNTLTAPNGDEWLVVTTVVDDPTYLNAPYITSSHFKKIDNDDGWNPTPCSSA